MKISKFDKKQLDYFDNWAENRLQKAERDNFSGLFEFETILSFLNLPRGSNILEIGCGAGRFTLKFLARGFNVFGLDISLSSLKKLNQSYGLAKSENWGKLQVGDKFPKGQNFDAVVCINILHHLENIGEMIKKSKDSLKKNGVIFIFEPNFLCFPWYFLFLFENVLPIEMGILKSNIWNLNKILRKLDFKNIKIKPYGFFPTRLLYWSPFLLKLLTVQIPKIPIVGLFAFHNMLRAEK